MKVFLTIILSIVQFQLFSQVFENHDLGKNRTLPKSNSNMGYNNEMDNYDVSYYGLNLEASNSNNYLNGFVTIKAKAVENPLSKFVIQLINQFTVNEVKLNGTAVTFTHQDNEIRIDISSPIPAGDFFTVTIFYNGYSGEGLTNSQSSTWGSFVTWSLSESFHAFEWFPVKQSLTDKADSADIYVTVPSNLEVASNGLLKQVVNLDNNKKRYEWESRYPIDYYLISMTISDYIEYYTFANLAGLPNPLPIQNFVYNVTGCLDYYKSAIDQTDEMIELFSDLFGTYPFANEKYGHVMAPFGGGMEHQTMTMVGYFSPGLIAHELAHMWFGDYITCGSWQDIWINEGFASYAEYIQLQHMASQASANDWMNEAFAYALQKPFGRVYLSATEANNENRIFDYNLSYKKGATIIHMLRYEINDDNLFFGIIKEYLSRYAYKTATGGDFRTVVNDITHKDYSWFFDQWYYGYGFPTFSFQYGNTENGSWVTITQTPSIQSSSLFKTSMDIKLNQVGGSVNERVFISENPQTFTFETYPVTGIQVDPDNWLLKKLGTITSDNTIQNNKQWVEVGPNPFNNHIYINHQTRLYIRIFDTNGKELHHFTTNEQNHLVDLSFLSEGVYVFTLNDGKRQINRKLVKI